MSTYIADEMHEEGVMNRKRYMKICGATVIALILGAAAPMSPCQAIPLPGDRLFPESVSITADGTAYIGSMTGGVVRVSLSTSKAEQWIAPGAYGSGALLGVLADIRNGLLWTCTNSFAAPGTVVQGADAGHWLKAFDLRTGESKISLPLSGDKAVCNDMAVGHDGSVYVTDTGQPRILRWRPGARALEIWTENPLFDAVPKGGGLDGIAFGADGNLYLNNVRNGALYRVVVNKDGSAGSAVKLTLSRPLENPDGMRALGGLSFVVAESVGRVTRLTVKGDAVDVTTLSNDVGHPTGVDSHAKEIWCVETHLSALFAPDKASAPTLPFQLTPVPLTR